MDTAKQERINFLKTQLECALTGLNTNPGEDALASVTEPLSLINLAMFLLFEFGDCSRAEFIQLQVDRPKNSLANEFTEEKNRTLVERIVSALAQASRKSGFTVSA